MRGHRAAAPHGTPEDPQRQSLRQRAEAQWLDASGGYPGGLPGLAGHDAASLLHDLQVHQIELEMQNEELRQAKEATEISRARYVDLYDLAPVGYCTVDTAGMVVQANLTLTTLLGVARSAMALQPLFSNFVLKPDQDAWYLLRKRLLRTGEPQSCELRLHRPEPQGTDSQAPIWVQLSASLRHDGVNQPLLHLAVSDITESKQAEVVLRQAKEDAEAASRAKARFLANMSHEIRTPMNAILGTVHLMRRDGVTPKQAAQVERIQMAADHLLSVIDDILDLSRIEAGKPILAQQDVSVADIVHRVVSIMAPQAHAKGLELTTELESFPQMLRGDPTRLAQALMNYVGNAVKFTAQGGITVRACLLEDQAASQLLRFEVTDTGHGIDPQKMHHLFTAFEQADNSATRAHGGTGLGLAITKELARCMGGEVGVRSQPGFGSTFWLTVRLPKSETEQDTSERAGATQEESPQALLASAYSGRRVLLVEDDTVNQTVLMEMLSDTGLVIDLANNGLEALEMARQTAYDLVLMDLQMPLLDGLEATRQIRSIAGMLQPPIVGLSANAFAEDRQRCLQAGMVEFLTKPVTPKRLCAVVLQCLRQPVRVMEPPAQFAENAEAVLARDYRDRRILIVDDHEEHRVLLQAFLASVWSDIDVAEDGARAVVLASQNHYDLILMDLQMRPMDGLEATRRIRAIPDNATVQILGLTASVGEQDVARCKDAGMNAVMRKVFGPDEPYHTILQSLSQRSAKRTQ